MKYADAWDELKKTLQKDSNRDWGHGPEVNALLQIYVKSILEYIEVLESIFE